MKRTGQLLDNRCEPGTQGQCLVILLTWAQQRLISQKSRVHWGLPETEEAGGGAGKTRVASEPDSSEPEPL